MGIYDITNQHNAGTVHGAAPAKRFGCNAGGTKRYHNATDYWRDVHGYDSRDDGYTRRDEDSYYERRSRGYDRDRERSRLGVLARSASVAACAAAIAASAASAKTSDGPGSLTELSATIFSPSFS